MQDKNHINHDSALIVNEGIEQPPIVNPYIGNFYKKTELKTSPLMNMLPESNRAIFPF
jgi:hypothetical protein